MTQLQIRARKGPKHAKRARIALDLPDNSSDFKPDANSSPRTDNSVVTDVDALLTTLPEPVPAAELVSRDLDSNQLSSSITPTTQPTRSRSSKLEKVVVHHKTFAFRKSFYDETSSPPREITHWHELGLPLPLVKIIHQLKYERPTPVQSQAVPIISTGCDLVGIAPTGSGKTAAFVVPMMRHLAANLANYRRASARGPFALVLVPTRELCEQISEALEIWTHGLNLRALACYGGSNIATQISELVSHECHVVVATPGRLIDLLAVNQGRVLSLSAVTYLVVDETDRMFDLGFGPQVRKIVDATRPDRQTVVFSATMSAAMAVLVAQILRDPIEICVGDRSKVAENVRQSVILVTKDTKLATLIDWLTKAESALVFVNTQSGADNLNVQLLHNKIRCQTLHGGMNQRDRTDVLSEFRQGNLNVIIATSVAARGLDLPKLKLVVNYDPASHLEDYVHRAGRTGRYNQVGECVTLLEEGQCREAFQLSKCFDITNLSIRAMADAYAASAERHKDSARAGFGGHGLGRLESQWNLRRTVEQDAYIGGHESQPEEVLVEISQLGNSFRANLVLEDVGKEARIAVTSPTKQNEVIERYHVSLTFKGSYGAKSSTKFALQIESPVRDDVLAAYRDLQQVIREKSGNGGAKYTSF